MKSLMDYAGSYRYLTGAAFALSAISSLTALVPFFYIWRIISQVLETAPHFENAAGVAHDGVDGAGIFYLVHAHLCSRFMVFPPVRFQSAAKHPLPGHGTYFKASCRLYE